MWGLNMSNVKVAHTNPNQANFYKSKLSQKKTLPGSTIICQIHNDDVFNALMEKKNEKNIYFSQAWHIWETFRGYFY